MKKLVPRGQASRQLAHEFLRRQLGTPMATLDRRFIQSRDTFCRIFPGENVNTRVSLSIAAILGGASITAFADSPVTADTEPAEQLATITVTAQRRTQNLQDVPISMQVLPAKSLAQLHVATFDDYVKYLPNVSTANNGPGQNEVFMRGLSAGSQASQGSGASGLFPNVAIYLDNQSVQLPGRNLDIYAADLNRIEVLEGPQGTLFGAGAEAGVIRYITNEPMLNRTEGSVNAGYGDTAHGDPNSNVSAVLNIPLIRDKMALRMVIYDDARGGYIDNVPATFTRQNTDIGIHYANYPAINGQCPNGHPNAGYCVPPNSPAINNYGIAQRAINPAVYQGGRAELLYKLNDDWDILITQMYQNLDTEGVFYQQPHASDGAPLPPLEVTLFNPAFNRDRFENTAWTVNGRIGMLHAVYTGGYLLRHVEQVGDYTNYARGVYADYYQCYGPGSGGEANLPSTCFSPSAVWRDTERNEHLQQEFRLSTPAQWRLRGIAGAYYEDDKVFDQTAWLYKSIPSCTANGAPGTPGNSGCLTNVGTAPGTTVQNPGVQGDTTAFYGDVVREVEQTAFFASLDFDLIPRVLTITAGTRHFDFDNASLGSVTSSFYCFDGGVPAAGCTVDSYNMDKENLRDSESGFRSRVNLSWHVAPDAMLYYTWSQGFRPGGFNFSGGQLHIYGSDGNLQYAIPRSYQSDSLTNNELGWKTQWLDNRLQWNGAVYRENWDNVQVAFFDPGLVSNLFFNTDGQDFLIKGIETSFVAKVTGGLTLQGAASWNQSRQTNSPSLIDNNPSSNNYGRPITEACDSSGQSCAPVTNPFGPVGAPSADAPPMQFSLRARYDWRFANYRWYAQVGAVHTAHSFTQAGSNPTIAQAGAVSTDRLRFEDPAYTIYDASAGVGRGAWDASVYGENLSNSHASVFSNSDQFIVAQTVLRPRVVGVSLDYRF
ncbi:MAG TPA: TonB-dependent receptor [Steroidobacteraceae bacterium]|nr:TonB-dependent receptor [Steroidobacteraceae bacterium]